MVRNALRFTARPPATSVRSALAPPLRAVLVALALLTPRIAGGR